MMKLKEIVFGFALTASTLNGETLQEFIIKNGARTPGDNIYDSYSYNVVYPIPGDSPYSLISGIQMSLKFRPIKIGAIGFQGSSCETTIELYRKSKDGEIDRVILTDNDSNGNFDAGDKLVFEGEKAVRTMNSLQKEEDQERFFYEIYQMARDFCGIRKEEKKEERRKSGGRLPVS